MSKTKRLPYNDICLDEYDKTDELSPLRIWASGSYKIIQRALRDADNVKKLSKSPNVLFIARELIKYAHQCGIRKNDLVSQGVRALYRGICVDQEYQKGDEIIERGFSSTSKSREVANTFTQGTGTLFRFYTKSLSDNFVAIIIDENVDEIYNEKEVLLLPGKITIIKVSDDRDSYKCEYMENIKLSKAITEMDTPEIQHYVGGGSISLKGGGGATPIAKLAGYDLVFWRGIYNRPIDVVGVLRLPFDPQRAVKYMQRHYRQFLAEYDRALDFIPDYKDLEKTYASMQACKHKTFMKMMSYSVHCAIVHPGTREIKTLHYRVPDGLFAETFDVSREEEARRTILNEYVAV